VDGVVAPGGCGGDDQEPPTNKSTAVPRGTLKVHQHQEATHSATVAPAPCLEEASSNAEPAPRVAARAAQQVDPLAAASQPAGFLAGAGRPTAVLTETVAAAPVMSCEIKAAQGIDTARGAGGRVGKDNDATGEKETRPAVEKGRSALASTKRSDSEKLGPQEGRHRPIQMEIVAGIAAKEKAVGPGLVSPVRPSVELPADQLKFQKLSGDTYIKKGKVVALVSDLEVVVASAVKENFSDTMPARQLDNSKTVNAPAKLETDAGRNLTAVVYYRSANNGNLPVSLPNVKAEKVGLSVVASTRVEKNESGTKDKDRTGIHRAQKRKPVAIPEKEAAPIQVEAADSDAETQDPSTAYRHAVSSDDGGSDDEGQHMDDCSCCMHECDNADAQPVHPLPCTINVPGLLKAGPALLKSAAADHDSPTQDAALFPKIVPTVMPANRRVVASASAAAGWVAPGEWKNGRAAEWSVEMDAEALQSLPLKKRLKYLGMCGINGQN